MHQGHGRTLYQAVYNYVCKQDEIAELSVEDPSERCEDIRDLSDLQMMLQRHVVAPGLRPPLLQNELDQMRRPHKIAKVSFFQKCRKSAR